LQLAGLTVVLDGPKARIDCGQEETFVGDIISEENFDRLFKVYDAAFVASQDGINIYISTVFGYLDEIGGPTRRLGLHRGVFLVGSCAVGHVPTTPDEGESIVVGWQRMRPTLRKARIVAMTVAKHRRSWDEYVLLRDALAREKEAILAQKAAEEAAELSDDPWEILEAFP
jgi:hypothetical protein